MKTWLQLSLFVASISSTISCTSLSSKSDRDPASINETCHDQTPLVDPLRLESQVFLRLQERERAASQEQLPQIYEDEFTRLQLMVTKSGLYSAGLTETEDPRLTLVKKARELKGEWDERFYNYLLRIDRIPQMIKFNEPLAT